MNDNISLTLARNYLGKIVSVTIDRPLGSKHPKYDFIYPVNYGFLENVLAPDGEGLDAYVLGVSEPLLKIEGVCIAIVHRNDDDDDKLIVVPDMNVSMTDQEIMETVSFQEQWFDSVILRE